MAIGITVDGITDEIGAPSFLHAFFSTLSAHCEPDGWGTRFPYLMNHLHQGQLSHSKSPDTIRELHAARNILNQLAPTEVVWEYENRSTRPPWGDNIAETITSLGNYFVSSTGRDLFELLNEALQASADERCDVEIS